MRVSRLRRFWLATTIICIALSVASADARAGCSLPTSLTLNELYSEAGSVVVARRASAHKGMTGKTNFEVEQVLKDPNQSITKGMALVIDKAFAGKEGELSLLSSNKATQQYKIWIAPPADIKAIVNYLDRSPAVQLPFENRADFFFKHLDSSDPVIAADAFREIRNACNQYAVLVALSKQFSTERIRKWIEAPNTPDEWLGLFSLMQGLNGDTSTVSIMESKLIESDHVNRPGIEHLISGYLLLTGESGLQLVERTKFLNKQVSFGETYSAILALRFLWTNGSGRISPARLQASMRLLLDRPEIADLTISDLAHWKDWSVQQRLSELYGTEGYNIPSMKRAIVRYMLASLRDIPLDQNSKSTRRIFECQEILRELRKRDPKLVADVERYSRAK